MAKSPLFDCLNSINEKTPYTYNKKDCSGYMLTLWLSHDPSLIGLCSIVNQQLFNIPDELVYKVYKKGVPQKRRFLKWTKKDASEEKESEIQELMDEYGLSEREAKLSVR